MVDTTEFAFQLLTYTFHPVCGTQIENNRIFFFCTRIMFLLRHLEITQELSLIRIMDNNNSARFIDITNSNYGYP